MHCRPIINNKFEEKTCGEGPSLQAIFDDDKEQHKIVSGIKAPHSTPFHSHPFSSLA